MWRDWLRRQHPLAIASFVLGAFSLTHLGTLLLDGAAGVVLGTAALFHLNRQGNSVGRSLAWWGIAVSAVSLIIAAKFAYQWV
jgi:hypothetical protein